MNIAIDARMIGPITHGISRYAFNLIRCLLGIDQKNRYFLITNDRYLENFVRDKKNAELVITGVRLYGVMEQFVIPNLLKKSRIDIFHTPTYSAPIVHPCKVIMTIHDLIHMVFPKQNAIIHKFYYHYIVKKAAHKAERIVTVSNFSKQDISKLLSISEDKIVVTYNSAESCYSEVTDVSKVELIKEKYGLKRRYILNIGNHRFHKNLESLIDAFKLLKRDGLSYLLVFSGEADKGLVSRLGRWKEDVVFLGDVSDKDLPAIYSAADIFVMPSLYEGFGLPALEAMACNTPVIASNRASLPEIIGRGGVYFDPLDINEIAATIKRVLSSKEEKDNLKGYGVARSKRFSWNDTARRTLELYNEVYTNIRIGFNAQKNLSMNTGIGVYTYNVSKMLKKNKGNERFYLYSTNNKINKNGNFTRNSIHKTGSILTDNNLIRILWEQCVLPYYQFKDRVDIFHYPDHTLSLFSKVCPAIITVHDIAFLKFPELFNRSRLIYKKIALKRSCKLAVHIIAVSHSTKRDVISRFPFVKDKIDVVHLGVDPCYRPIDDISSFRKRFALPSKFILFLGTLEPRKNLVRLIRTFNSLKKKRAIPHELVIAGTKGWLYKNIFQEVERLNLKRYVHFTGFVQPKDIPFLYNCADLFVYPSLYEGFGLPPLEAMACGTPVITSNSSSLPEVVGDASIMIDPFNREELEDAIYRVISKDNLSYELKNKGIARAKNFSWDNTIKKTIDIYKKVYRKI